MTETATTPKRILIIEDHADVATIERLLCSMEGYDARVAVNGEDGWSQLHEFRPDLIILDLMLPGALSGADLLKRINTELAPDVPRPRILVVSALINPASAARLQEGDGVETMTKPFKIHDLADRVQAMLSRP